MAPKPYFRAIFLFFSYFFVKFVGVFWIFSSRMIQMGGDVVLSHVIILVFMIIVLMSRCHCRWSMIVMMVIADAHL